MVGKQEKDPCKSPIPIISPEEKENMREWLRSRPPGPTFEQTLERDKRMLSLLRRNQTPSPETKDWSDENGIPLGIVLGFIFGLVIGFIIAIGAIS